MMSPGVGDMVDRWTALAFGAAALVHVVLGVLCAIVWHQLNATGTLDAGETVDVAPFAGGFSTLRVLWFVAIAIAVLTLLLAAMPPRPLVLFLALASAAFGVYGLWVTSARPTFGENGPRMLGASDGYPEATILYAVAAGLAFLGILLARASRSTPAYDS